VAWLVVWNSLPAAVCHADILHSFKHTPKCLSDPVSRLKGTKPPLSATTITIQDL